MENAILANCISNWLIAPNSDVWLNSCQNYSRVYQEEKNTITITRALVDWIKGDFEGALSYLQSECAKFQCDK